MRFVQYIIDNAESNSIKKGKGMFLVNIKTCSDDLYLRLSLTLTSEPKFLTVDSECDSKSVINKHCIIVQFFSFSVCPLLLISLMIELSYSINIL